MPESTPPPHPRPHPPAAAPSQSSDGINADVPNRPAQHAGLPVTAKPHISDVAPVDQPLSVTTPPPVPTDVNQESHLADVHATAAAVAVMPGSAQRNAEEIQAVSPEGVPADPKLGPAGIRGVMGIMIAFVLIASAISAIWIGWLALVIGALGIAMLFFNPALWAARDRAHDREIVVEKRINSGELVANHPDARPHAHS